MLEKYVVTILELNCNQRLGNYRTKLNICHHMHTSSTPLQNRSFHVVERTRTSSKFSLSNMQIWGGFCCRRPRGCLSSLICDAERCFWLRKLICEIEKKGGTFCPPNTLYQICVGIQRYLRENENADIDIVRDSRCKLFQDSLDSHMNEMFDEFRTWQSTDASKTHN